MNKKKKTKLWILKRDGPEGTAFSLRLIICHGGVRVVGWWSDTGILERFQAYSFWEKKKQTNKFLSVITKW